MHLEQGKGHIYIVDAEMFVRQMQVQTDFLLERYHCVGSYSVLS